MEDVTDLYPPQLSSCWFCQSHIKNGGVLRMFTCSSPSCESEVPVVSSKPRVLNSALDSMERFPFLTTDRVRCGRVSWAQVPECSSDGGESKLECSGNCKALRHGGNMGYWAGVFQGRGIELPDPQL